MEKSDLKPLAPRQRLAIDPIWAKAVTAAVGAGVAVGGKFLSRLIWERYVLPKRKAKHAQKLVRDVNGHFQVIEIETLEEHVVKTRKQIRVTLKRRG